MLVLVANLGSTSFKYKLLDMELDGEPVAKGGFERIGQPDSPFKTHGDVTETVLSELKTKPDAIGFKAVHGGPITGAVRVTDEVLSTMQQFADIAPAHNPAYIAAMKAFREKLPTVPQVAAFETAFHQTVPMSRQTYAIPFEWTDKLQIRRYGFHGASHRYIAMRSHQLVPGARRVISCHLGGSSSICAIQNGKSIATSMGLTPQTGLPQNNRVGDFDTFALQRLLKHGMTADAVLKKLCSEGGLLGISGVSNDMRDIEKAAISGNDRARLAIDVFVESVRHYIGAYLVTLGGCDVLVFTGGIGENAVAIREAVCRNLDFAGLVLDANKNQVSGQEAKISKLESTGDIWAIPTNEELIVAMQVVSVLSAN